MLLLQDLAHVMEGCTYADGFGRRFRCEGTGEALESLHLCDELSLVAETGPLLVERAARLEAFRHPAFAPIKRIERRGRPGTASVVIVSEAVPGTRLADLIRTPGAVGGASPRAWLPLFQAVVSAVAALHALGRDLSHGAIGPERIVVRPNGQPVLVEPLLGAAIEPLGMARLRLWRQYRVPVAPTAGTARFDQRCDVLQLGILALALGAGRPLGRDDFPGRLPQLLGVACPRESPGDPAPSAQALRGWLVRALQFDARSAFRSAVEADAALTALLRTEDTGEKTPVIVALSPATGLPFRNDQEDHQAVSSRHETVPAAPRAAQEGRPSPLGRALRASSVAVCLITLWGATYLGARSYLGLDLPVPAGVLVVDSRPAGLEVLVDGSHHGVTPTTIQLRPGAYTLALRGGRGTTLVPVMVSPGQRRLERIELQRGGRTPKRISEELGHRTGK